MYKIFLRKSLEKAFKVWEQAADVKFSEVVIPPEDIQIRWGLRIVGIEGKVFWDIHRKSLSCLQYVNRTRAKHVFNYFITKDSVS